MRDSFVFYNSYYEAISELDEKTQLQIFKAVCEYALNGNIPELTGISKAIFALIKPTIDANEQRYINGKKGGRPSKKTNGYEKEKPTLSNLETVGYENSKPNVNDNVNDNVNVNDNETENVTEKENEKKKADKSDSTPTPPKSKKKVFGEYSHVKLTDEEYKRLCDDYSEKIILDYIRKIDEYLQMTGKKAYKDYNLAIRKWLNRDNVKGGEENGETPVLRGLVF